MAQTTQINLPEGKISIVFWLNKILSVFLNVSKKNNLLVPPYLGYFQNDILGYQAFQLNFSPDLHVSLIILSLASILIMNITTN